MNQHTDSGCHLVSVRGFFDSRYSCAEDSFTGPSGLCCGNYLVLYVRRSQQALNGSVPLLVTANLVPKPTRPGYEAK